MWKAIFGGALVVVLLVLTGVIAYQMGMKNAACPRCGVPPTTQQPIEPVPTTGTGTKETSPLAGTSWKLVVLMQEGVSTPIPQGATVTAEFDASQISGNNSCNNYFGPYSTSGESITIGQMGSTMMACDNSAEFEQAYMKILGEAGSYKLHSGNKLTIYSATEGKTALDYEQSN